jgi:predicted transcriptional regulator
VESGCKTELPEDVKELIIKKVSSIINRNIYNFIPYSLIELKPDMNIKAYEKFPFLKIISVEDQVPLIDNLIIIGHK